MFGPDLLVAPILEEGKRECRVYLPKGANWIDAVSKTRYEGGRYVTIPSPLGIIPVMIREGASINEIKGFEPTC